MSLYSDALLSLDKFRLALRRPYISDDAQMIIRAIGSMNGREAGGPPNPNAPTNGYAVVDTLRVTGTGSYDAGAVFLSFQNAGDANAQVNDTILKAGEVLNFPSAFGMLLPEITYVATGTDLLISAVRPPPVA